MKEKNSVEEENFPPKSENLVLPPPASLARSVFKPYSFVRNVPPTLL